MNLSLMEFVQKNGVKGVCHRNLSIERWYIEKLCRLSVIWILLLLHGVWNYSITVIDNFNGLPTFAFYFLGLVRLPLNKLSHDFRREFRNLDVSFLSRINFVTLSTSSFTAESVKLLLVSLELFISARRHFIPNLFPANLLRASES